MATVSPDLTVKLIEAMCLPSLAVSSLALCYQVSTDKATRQCQERSLGCTDWTGMGSWGSLGNNPFRPGTSDNAVHRESKAPGGTSTSGQFQVEGILLYTY